MYIFAAIIGAVMWEVTESAGVGFITSIIVIVVMLIAKSKETAETEKAIQENKISKMQKAKQDREADLETAKEKGFCVSKCISTPSEEEYIAVDNNSKQFLIKSKNVNAMLPFSDLLNFELVNDGTSVLSGNSASAAKGALWFGATGAIVGASGDKTISTFCSDLHINITINSIDTPLTSMNILSEKTDCSTEKYKECVNSANDIVALLTVIYNNK